MEKPVTNMEILKSLLCCCCDQFFSKRRDSEASTKVIITTNQAGGKMAHSFERNLRRLTFAHLAQPDFYIPQNEAYLQASYSYPRKCSAPSILTTMSHVQPSTFRLNIFNASSQELVETTEENNNASRRGSFEPETEKQLSPVNRRLRRLSAASGSRRPSMTSFGISSDDLDTDLYDSCDSPIHTNAVGRLCFSLIYSSEEQEVTVYVTRARQMPVASNNDKNGSLNVKVSLVPRKKHVTRQAVDTSKWGCRNDCFEPVSFHPITENHLQGYMVKFTLSSNEGSQQHKVGTVFYPLKELPASRRVENMWKDVLPVSLDESYSGNLYMSLSYHPSSSVLIVSDIRIEELKYRNKDEDIEGLFVTLMLYNNAKVCSKERTTVIPLLANQTFEEQFHLDLPNQLIHQSCLVLVVFGKTSSGKKVRMGRVTTGPPFFASGSSLEHWTKMLSIPYTAVSMTHKLRKDSGDQSKHTECNIS